MNKVFSFAVAALLCASALPALAQSTAATKPTCAAGDPVVWENTSSKVYHLEGDKYFGTTKHGAYACKSVADAAGYHAAGHKSSGSSSMSGPNAAASPSAMASPMAGKHHHHHHHGMSGASPAPTAGLEMASPAPGTTSSPSP